MEKEPADAGAERDRPSKPGTSQSSPKALDPNKPQSILKADSVQQSADIQGHEEEYEEDKAKAVHKDRKSSSSSRASNAHSLLTMGWLRGWMPQEDKGNRAEEDRPRPSPSWSLSLTQGAQAKTDKQPVQDSPSMYFAQSFSSQRSSTDSSTTQAQAPKARKRSMVDTVLGRLDTDSESVKEKSRTQGEETRKISLPWGLPRAIRGERRDKSPTSGLLSASPSKMASVPDEMLGASLDGLQDVQTWEDLKSLREQLRKKILMASEQLRVLQSQRDMNVSEYLHLVSKVDRAQATRVRSTFEKLNQRSSLAISQLQKKLDLYQQKLQEMETHLLGFKSATPSHNNLEMGLLAPASPQNTGLGSSLDSTSPFKPLLGLPTVPSSTDNPLMVSQSLSIRDLLDAFQAARRGSGNSTHELEELGSSGSEGQSFTFLTILEEIVEVKEAQIQLDINLKSLAEMYTMDMTNFQATIHDEKQRNLRLETQLNDLTELHQNEVFNLKQDLASLEEKMAYQAYENSRDIWEVLETLHTKVGRIEQQQQSAQMEVLEHINTRELVGKGVNLLLALFTVLLMLISSLAAFILPFIHTKLRATATFLLLTVCVLAWKHRDLLREAAHKRLGFGERE